MDSCSIDAFVEVLNLDISRHLSICRDLRGSIYRVRVISDSLLSISLNTSVSSHLPNTFFSLYTSFPRNFRPQDHLFSYGMIFFTHSIMHFMFSDLTFGIFDKLWGFQNQWSFCEIFGMGIVEMTFNHHALHLICIITLLHAF